MNKKGYQVLWTSERKYITFTCPNGKKCRDIKLHDKKYVKENIEYELQLRKQLYARKELYHSKFGGAKLTEYAKPYAEFNAGDGSDSGKGLGYNAGHPADQRRALSEGVGDVYRTDYGGTDESTAGRLVGNGAEKVQPSTLGCENSDSFPTGSSGEYPSSDEGLRATGWEESRKDYERFIGTRFGSAPSNNGSHEAVGHKNISYPLGDMRGLIGGGIGNLGDSLSSVFITDDEDEEEKRKRIQAQENGEAVGALLGLAAGAVMSAYDDQSDDDDGLTMETL
jgi:hypothetical protein